MFKILIVDDEIDILEILETLVSAEFSCEITTATSGNQAVELLKKHKFDLILCDYSMPNGNGAVVFNYNKLNDNLPFIFVSGGYLEDYVDIGNFYSVNELNSYIHKPVDIDELNAILYKVIEKGMAHSSEYVKVSDFLLFNFDITKIDIYLKINDEKFVKIKNEGDSSVNEISRYRNKSSDYFYLERNSFKGFLLAAISAHLTKLKSKNLSREKLELCGQSIEVLALSLEFLGLTSESNLVIETTVESCLDVLLNNPGLQDRVEIFISEKGYKVSHSITMARLCYVLAHRIGLGRETTITKLIQASVLHDLLISEESSSVLLLTPVATQNLRSAQVKEIKEHALKMYNLLKDDATYSSDTLNMVKDHHEIPNGGGFPRGLTETNLSGLSLLFNFCLHCADHFFHEGAGVDSINLLIGKLRERGFDKGHGEKIFKEFISITSNIF